MLRTKPLSHLSIHMKLSFQVKDFFVFSDLNVDVFVSSGTPEIPFVSKVGGYKVLAFFSYIYMSLCSSGVDVIEWFSAIWILN
jgi:hypothetical protein